MRFSKDRNKNFQTFFFQKKKKKKKKKKKLCLLDAER
jgi:hypothetical protein